MQGQRAKIKSRLLHLQAEITRLQAKRKQLTQQLQAAQEEGQQRAGLAGATALWSELSSLR